MHMPNNVEVEPRLSARRLVCAGAATPATRYIAEVSADDAQPHVRVARAMHDFFSARCDDTLRRRAYARWASYER